MAQFRTSAELVNMILARCGEPTNGNSSYITQALQYLTKVHNVIIAGGNIFDLDVAESWTWAKAKNPIILKLEAPYADGGVTFTQGSEAGTFSVAPSSSLAGWHIRVGSDGEVYRIATHTAASTAFELDGAYVGASVAVGEYAAFKLDYEIVPTHLYVDSTNNKLDYVEVAGTGAGTYAVTLTSGSYTPDALATEVKTQLDSLGNDTWTVTYSSVTKKFTITSDLTGSGTSVSLLGATGTNASTSALPLLGFDDLDYTTLATYTSTYPVGAISRFVEPFVLYGKDDPFIMGLDELSFMQEWPLGRVREGTPRFFTKLAENRDGSITVRFNAYPTEVQRIDINWIPAPRDLQNNSVSYPLVPRKFIDILEYGASFFLLTDKEDNKSEKYFALAQTQLKAMLKQNRNEQAKYGRDFGSIVPRLDLVDRPRKLRYGYTAADD